MNYDQTDIQLIRFALEEAKSAFQKDEVPVGAIIYDPINKKIISKSGNLNITEFDPTAHAEINVIRNACKTLGQSRLYGLWLYVTLEPCAMCACAISFARIDRLCFGAYDEKGGGVVNGAKIFDQKTCHHKPQIIGGIEQENCTNILKDFFRQKR